MILRHDVDQYPRSALRMSDVEVALGARSTWYSAGGRPTRR